MLQIAACGEPARPAPRSAPVTVPAPAPSPAPPSEPARPVPVDAGRGPDACAPASGAVGCRLCAGDGALLLEIVPADLVQLPSDAAVLAQSPPAAQPDPRRLEYTIVATPDLLVAQIFTCPGCRRRMGWGVAIPFARLRALPPDDARALQQALGWPPEPRLDSHDAWRAAAPQGPPRRSPRLPSCAAEP